MPIAKYLGFNILAWSTVLCCHALCFSFPALVSIRTLLGIFEAVCQPAFLIMSSIWYKREEQAQVVTYWYMMNGAQQICGGLLAYAFSQIRHPSYKANPGNAAIRSWQAIFITYGMISFCWGLFVLYWLPGKFQPLPRIESDSVYLTFQQTAPCAPSVSPRKTRSY